MCLQICIFLWPSGSPKAGRALYPTEEAKTLHLWACGKCLLSTRTESPLAGQCNSIPFIQDTLILWLQAAPCLTKSALSPQRSAYSDACFLFKLVWFSNFLHFSILGRTIYHWKDVKNLSSSENSLLRRSVICLFLILVHKPELRMYLFGVPFLHLSPGPGVTRAMACCCSHAI